MSGLLYHCSGLGHVSLEPMLYVDLSSRRVRELALSSKMSKINSSSLLTIIMCHELSSPVFNMDDLCAL